MKRCTLTRRTPMKRAALRKVSKKAWWPKLRAKLKPEFIRAGVTTCEARYDGCWIDNGLGFGHSKKRRNITTRAEQQEVCLICNHCHSRLELNKEPAMGALVQLMILERETQVRYIP